jgi:two-component system chemotaxis response regulator CheY
MAGPTHVLVVDDDTFVRQLLRDALEQEPDRFRISEAEDGELALEKVRADPPALVLLDLFMPRRSGIDALSEILAISPSTRVVIISSLEVPALIDQAKAAGAVDFIVKPFHPLEVLSAVDNALGGA